MRAHLAQRRRDMKAVAWIVFYLASASAASVTCPNTGTFTDDPPFDGFPLPFCEDQVNPTYDMYTRSNRNVPQTLDRDTLPSFFDPSRMTFFIVHGWNSDEESSWLGNMKDAFLDRVDSNVVIVGWGGPFGSQNLQYRESASTTRVVGADLGDAINNLVANAGGVKGLMWCSGHSLGAHVCGFAGRRHNQLGRITGMDPAGPDYVNNPDRQIGLWTDCADFVDTINTDPRYGSTPLSVGHQNHYPNGGHDQPGCATDSCSHSLAHEFMTESIKADCFISRQICTDTSSMPDTCSFCGADCAFMGYAANPSSTDGDYYLETQANVPYCLS